MSIDLLRADANERVDLLDFQYLANTSFEEALRVQANWLLTDYNKAQQWVLDGFAMTNPSGKQLQVALGRAILARRVSGAVRYGIVTGTGDLTKIVDMTALTPGTYNVYIRFEFVDGDNSSRIFWNPAGSGSEIVQTMATRLKANWSMRVETGSPGAEWLQIGTANNVGGSLVIVDQRPFYFEGRPSASYASGWSADGGGMANDRNADRQAYGVKDFQTFTAAIRQCLEDIKGRGLRRWWERDIGGINIGFDAAPIEDRVALGDADMYLQWASDYPTLRMGAGGDDLTYDRAGNHWLFKIAAVEEMRLGTDGLAIANGLYVGDATGTPVDNNIYAEGYLTAAGGRVYWGADDYQDWDGTNWKFVLDGVEELRLTSAGAWIQDALRVGSGSSVLSAGNANISGGLIVGYDANPSADTIMCGDSYFGLDLNSGAPRIRMGNDEYISHTRGASGGYGFSTNSNVHFSMAVNDAWFGASAVTGIYVAWGNQPNPQNVGSGFAHYLDYNNIPFCVGAVNGIGGAGLEPGQPYRNVNAVVYLGVGSYRIDYKHVLTAAPAVTPPIVVSVNNSGAVAELAMAFGNSANSFWVQTKNATNAAAVDAHFSFVTFGYEL